MESKSDNEEMSYPYISFVVDNFEDMFKDAVVRDGESVGIELTAADPDNNFNVVLFSASVPYEAIQRVYDARTSQTVRKRLSQTNLFNLFSSSGGKYGESRVEFVRLDHSLLLQGVSENGPMKTGAKVFMECICKCPHMQQGSKVLM